MPHATSYAQLRSLSAEDLIRLYDETADHTDVGLNFLRDEIVRRHAAEQTEAIVVMTRHMRNLTIAITLLTAINVAATIVLLLK